MVPSIFGQWFVASSSHRLPRILVLDGGVSTHLERLIAGSFAHKELWSSSLLLSKTGQDHIRQGHEDWIQAKANVISTVTYQLHFESSQWPKGLALNDEKVKELWNTAIQLAHHSANKNNSNPTFVLASSGCYGAALSNGAEYTGEYGFKAGNGHSQLQEFHRRKLKLVAKSTADLTAIETVPSLAECIALADLLQNEEYSCFISLSCRNESQLNDGTPLATALREFRKVPNDRLVAIGLNCCAVEHMESLLTILVNELRHHHPLRGIVLYPNSGESWDSASGTWLHDGSDDDILVSSLMNRIQQIESQWPAPYPSILVGGCCRTTPSTIELLHRRVQEHLATKPSDANSS